MQSQVITALRAHPQARSTILLSIAVSLGGCGKAPATYPVAGKVVYPNGSPLTGGVIELSLTGGEAVNARGPIERDGSFHVVTPGKGDGAVLGTHRVAVRALAQDSEPLDGKPTSPAQIDPRFEKYETSQLQVVVEPKPNQFTIEVKRPNHVR
jgi:hypothetical protein